MDSESPSKLVRWPVLRVQPGSEKRVFLLSGEFVRLPTHYFRRTVLCVGDDSCPLCSLLPSRSYWYLPAVHQEGRQPCLLELSATAASSLEQNARLLGGRLGAGLRVRLFRQSPRKPLYTEVLEGCEPFSHASSNDWLTALMAVFLMPAFKRGETLEEYGARTIELVRQRATLVLASVEAAAEKGVKGRR